MGTLHDFNLEEYGCSVLIETGTGRGISLQKALDTPCFDQYYSIEISKETYELAKAKFADYTKLTLINSESAGALRKLLPKIPKDVKLLIFLDAHFPGEVSSTFKGYKHTEPTRLKLPLEEELEIVAELRKGCKDVIICDDLRIYEDGPYAHGNMPEYAETLPPKKKNIKFVSKIFPKAIVEKSFKSEGYLIIKT